MPDRKTIAHITHEASARTGGIGQVLQGLLTCKTYQNAVSRSIIIGPLLDAGGNGPLGQDDDILYSSIDDCRSHPWCAKFEKIEREFGIQMIYATRRFRPGDNQVESTAEVILIDVTDTVVHPVNALKRWLYEEFGVESHRYETQWEYEQYLRLAPAALALLRTIGAADPAQPTVLIAHEYMGLPTALAGVLDPLGSFKTVFHAHEVATIRRLIENSPGHDTMFYNAMHWGLRKPYYLNEMFGPQEFFFEHALIKAARFCDNIVGVGDNVLKELAFLGPEFQLAAVDLAYDGLDGNEITLEEKLSSRQLLQQYAENLLGARFDYVFSHVTRLTMSKAIWRDLAVLDRLDEQFQRTNQTAVLFILSTEGPGRRPLDVYAMEKDRDWPVAHYAGDNDLTEAEAGLNVAVQGFNARHRNVRIVFVNQFGWSAPLCGERMPDQMEFTDLRKGTDLEFGQSIYEPFGISVLEPLAYGGLSVVSDVSGCLGFLRSLTGGKLPPNIILADYTQLSTASEDDLTQLLAIGHPERAVLEDRVSQALADEILQRLPSTNAESEALLQSGWQLAQQMSWDNVCRKYFLPAINRAYLKRRARQIA